VALGVGLEGFKAFQVEDGTSVYISQLFFSVVICLRIDLNRYMYFSLLTTCAVWARKFRHFTVFFGNCALRENLR